LRLIGVAEQEVISPVWKAQAAGFPVHRQSIVARQINTKGHTPVVMPQLSIFWIMAIPWLAPSCLSSVERNLAHRT
jgi:hypothetical protein